VKTSKYLITVLVHDVSTCVYESNGNIQVTTDAWSRESNIFFCEHPCDIGSSFLSVSSWTSDSRTFAVSKASCSADFLSAKASCLAILWSSESSGFKFIVPRRITNAIYGPGTSWSPLPCFCSSFSSSQCLWFSSNCLLASIPTRHIS
jgi:hypothetical protein